jgi:hypothetical protein
MSLLVCPRSYREVGGAAQESIDEAAKTQQVIERADERNRLWCAGGLVVSPVGWDERLTPVWQDKHELQAARHAGLPKDLQTLSMEWVMQTRDCHPFREVLRMGSVW